MRLIAKYWQLILLAVFCLTPLIWFWGKDPGVLINGLDTNFPLDPLIWLKRRFFVWNDTINAGVDFSSSSAGLFFHFIQVVPYMLGFSLKNVEIFSIVFWFSAVVLSSFLLARLVVPKSRVAQIIFVAIYSFNIYLFNTWENVKVANLSLVASLPLFVWIIYQRSQKVIGAGRAFIYLCLASILASGSGINPAYFSVIVLAIFIQGIILRKIKIPAVSILALLLINLFWILPLSNFLMSSQTKSLEDLGLTNWLESLSENTSITNVVRLQGAWDWYALDKYGMPQYLPYTLNYLYKWPFIVVSFAVPVFAFTSFLFVKFKRRFWYIFFGILALLGIFLGVGSHAPTGGIFVFLYKHIPFLSFFRSPWYIFTPLLLIAYAGLTGIFFEELSFRLNNGFNRLLFGIFALLFLVFYGIYNYPLVTGKIFRPDKEGFYVKFPDYLFDAKKWLSENDASKRRIISYPDDDLESFSWGYKGTESILSLFSNREVVAPSFNIPSKTFTFLLRDFYSHVKRGEYESAISVANFFSSDTIFYKKDSPTLSPPITDEIKDFVSQVTFGDWVFMKANLEQNDKIYSPTNIYNNLSYPDDTVFQAPLLTKGSAVVNGTIDTQISQIPGSGSYLSLLRAYTPSGHEDDFATVQHYEFTLPKDGVFDFAIEKLFIDKSAIAPRLDSVSLKRSLINQTDGFIKIGPLDLKKGTHVLEIVYPEPQNILDVGGFASFIEGVDLRKEELPVNSRDTLAAINFESEEKLIRLPTKNFNPFIRYVVGFDYKYIYGSVPILDVIQSAPTAPVKTHPIYPGAAMDWESKREVYKPVETNSGLELWIRMPPNKLGDRSKAYFENMFIKRIYDNKVFVVERAENSKTGGEIEFKKVSPVKYEVGVMGEGFLVFSESYNKGWVLKQKGEEEVGPPIHFTVNGYANGWYIPGNLGEKKEYMIYYRPQGLYVVGAVMSVATFLLACALPFSKWKRR